MGCCQLERIGLCLSDAGGQYYFAAQLEPAKIRSTISFIVGIVGWIASVVLVIPRMAVGVLSYSNADMVSKPWTVFVGFQATNIFVLGFDCFTRILPMLIRLVLCMSLCTIIIVFVFILSVSPRYQSASSVFTDFVNNTGWNGGIALLTGAIGVDWGFSCPDAVTLLAEVNPRSQTKVSECAARHSHCGHVYRPPNLSRHPLLHPGHQHSCYHNHTSPIDRIVQPGTQWQSRHGNQPGKLVLMSTLGSLWGVHTWQSHLAWSFARDHGLPFPNRIGHILPSPFDVPIYARGWSCFWVGVLVCRYVVSTVAINSFVGGPILMQYMTYSICVILILLKGRSKFQHGPFCISGFGPIANVVTFSWTISTAVFYCSLPYLPVTLNTINCVSVVIVGILRLCGWCVGLRGKSIRHR